MAARKFPNVAAWRTIAGREYYFRSKAEYRYALYLQFLMKNLEILKWEHEPETFWFEGIKRGVTSYKPDFKVYYDRTEPSTRYGADVQHYWVEVKGYMDPKSATKIKRFRKYFPNETLIVIDKKWFALNYKKLKGFIKGWE